MADDEPAVFEWRHIEQHHYECTWRGYHLTAHEHGWKVAHNGCEHCGQPRIQRGARVSAERRAEVARSNAEGYAYRHFYGRQADE